MQLFTYTYIICFVCSGDGLHRRDWQGLCPRAGQRWPQTGPRLEVHGEAAEGGQGNWCVFFF